MSAEANSRTMSAEAAAAAALILKATIADAKAIDELVNSAYRGESSKQGWTTEADLLDGTRIDEAAVADLIEHPKTTILKYVQDNQILGCVELRQEGGNDKQLYLGMLSVAPHTQGQGIGKQLLQASEEHARSLGGITTICMTVISVRHELIDWYMRRGYQRTGERRSFVVPDTRWGIPRQELEFVVLQKHLATL